jgi:uncharacterized protein YndB with AHSA1/START domain
MYSLRIDIASPPARVFAVLTDPTLMRSWNPEIVELQQPEELKVGDVSRAVVQEFGRRFIAELRLTRREQDAAIAYDMTTPMWSGHAEYILTAVHSGTRLDFRFHPEPPLGWKRIPARWMATLTRPLVQRVQRRKLETLRNLVENRGKTTVPRQNGNQGLFNKPNRLPANGSCDDHRTSPVNCHGNDSAYH